MGEESLDDRVMDVDLLNGLYAMGVVTHMFLENEQYDSSKAMYWSWKRVSNDYVDFRLEHYDSEGRAVVRETYKVLGYNPYLPTKYEGGHKDE